MKLLIATILLAGCVKQGQVRETHQPLQLRNLCHDAKYSDVCAPTSNEMPTVIDINLAVPAAFHTNVG
jgi:hypothetical protein